LNVEIDTASVNSSDAQRDQHLGNGDFFVPQFPTIHFQSILGKIER
jgi:polyisoprenoid-binding protein YceI